MYIVIIMLADCLIMLGLNVHVIVQLLHRNGACSPNEITKLNRSVQNQLVVDSVYPEIIVPLCFSRNINVSELPDLTTLLMDKYRVTCIIVSLFSMIFSCDQAALWMVFSVRLSVCPSVTPFWLCSHHRIIMKFSAVITLDQRKVHANGQGQRSKVKVTEVTTQIFVSGL